MNIYDTTNDTPEVRASVTDSILRSTVVKDGEVFISEDFIESALQQVGERAILDGDFESAVWVAICLKTLTDLADARDRLEV
jgi:hypothetical protein